MGVETNVCVGLNSQQQSTCCSVHNFPCLFYRRNTGTWEGTKRPGVVDLVTDGWFLVGLLTHTFSERCGKQEREDKLFFSLQGCLWVDHGHIWMLENPEKVTFHHRSPLLVIVLIEIVVVVNVGGRPHPLGGPDLDPGPYIAHLCSMLKKLLCMQQVHSILNLNF